MGKLVTIDTGKTARKRLLTLLLRNGAYVLLILMCLVMAILDKNFLTVSNLMNVALQSSIMGVLALGMTFVICTGNIDISVGNLIGLCSVCGVALVQFYQAPWYVAMLVMILVGALIGVINGALVAYMNIPSMLVTLSTQCIASGMVLFISKGKSWTNLPYALVAVSKSKILGVSALLWAVLVLYIVFHYLLSYTVFGRKVLAVGGSMEAARASGIRVERTILLTYIISGTVAGIAGILQTARLGAFYASMGSGMEMNVIAATVIGGTSMTGGRGSIIGTLAGVLLLGVINNALNLLGVDANMQNVARGLIIMIAIILDAIRIRIDKDS